MSSSSYEKLYALLREHKQCYVLVDRLAACSLRDEVQAWEKKQNKSSPLNDRIFKDTEEQSPLLLRLQFEDIAFAELLLALAITEATEPDINGRSICAFIFSTVGLKMLASALTRKLSAEVQSIGGIYFRYFDPRVMHQLTRILAADQLSGILAKCSQCGYVNWQGELVILSPRAEVSAHFSPIFSYDEWLILEEIETVNLSLCRLKKLGELPDAGSESRVISLINAGKLAGLTDQPDLVTYVVYTMKLGENFSMHNKLPDVISMAIQYKVPLADAFEDVSGIHLGDRLENPTYAGKE